MKPHRMKIWMLLALAAGLGAQAPSAAPLTLNQAQTIALRQRPLLQESAATAAAAAQAPEQLRAQYFPQVTGELTAVGAENNSRVAAGGLNNPVIYSRYANGLSLSQFLTDFGRRQNLVRSSNDQARAAVEDTATTRAQVLLQVDQAYYNALQAQAVLRVARQAVDERELIARQVGVLAQNKLRSTLDVSFAQVNLAQAQLLLSEAESSRQSTVADLGLAMGTRFAAPPVLQDEPMPGAPPAELATVIANALQHRPEMASAGFELDAAHAYAQAQRELWRPTLSAVGAAGLTPTGAVQLPDRYAAAGVNLSIPLFNGGLFGAERREAEFQENASQHKRDELANQIAHDVQVAWLAARTAQDQMALTQKLQQQATLALNLAQSRYQLGLGTIVELSQAQLNQTQADIAAAQAKYQFQLAMAALAYQTGDLH